MTKQEIILASLFRRPHFFKEPLVIARRSCCCEVPRRVTAPCQGAR